MEFAKEPPQPRRRGRKSNRPELRGKKTEDLDKYWMRRFKGYAKKNIPLDRVRDRDFWTWFLSKDSEPGLHGSQFKSFSKQHREYLRSHNEFVNYLNDWFIS